MSHDNRLPLSKRSSVWESTFTLPNYTRPQGWSVVEPGMQMETGPEQFQQLVLQIIADNFGGITLEEGSMEECIQYIVNACESGYSLSYNRLKRLIGRWLALDFHPEQTEYNEGYRELATN